MLFPALLGVVWLYEWGSGVGAHLSRGVNCIMSRLGRDDEPHELHLLGPGIHVEVIRRAAVSDAVFLMHGKQMYAT